MKGSPQILEQLQVLLTDELTAIDQYAPHVARAKVWGYEAHAAYVEERLADERKHSEMLIKRIYELDGVPNTVPRNPVSLTSDILEGLAADRIAEVGAIIKYNRAIAIAVAEGDNATRDMLAAILKDEDDHILDIEKRLVQITQVTLPQWLTTQIQA